VGKKEEPLPGKKLLEDVKSKTKAKQKENTEMKNIKNNSTVKTVTLVIVTIIATLAVVYGAYQIYLMGKADGIQYEKDFTVQMRERVSEEISVLDSKTNQ
jgi:Tfp pilus assembly protein PilO